MPLLGTATTFATLVGLICNWKAERGAAATDRFQDFLVYLTNHNFQALREQIVASSEVQQELRGLLLQDTALVNEKLNVVCQGIAALSDKIDALSPLAHALRATSDDLSEQAINILKIFEQVRATQMIVFREGQAFGFMPMGGQFGLNDTRFVPDDLNTLCAFGFLRLSGHNSDGCPIYSITRNGADFAKDKPEVRHPDGRLVGERR